MSYAEFQFKDQKTSAPGKTSHEAELSQLTAEGRQNSQPGDLTTRLFRSLTSHPSLLCRQHGGTPSLCSFLRAFLNILSFYCSLRTLSILTWSETELLREDIGRTSGDMNGTSTHSQDSFDHFCPFSFSLIPFIASQTGCFSSWLVSSWSSADVNCLKGGVNLITYGRVDVTRGPYHYWMCSKREPWMADWAA